MRFLLCLKTSPRSSVRLQQYHIFHWNYHLPHGPLFEVGIEGMRARKHAQQIRCAAHVPLAEVTGKPPRAVETVLKTRDAVYLEVKSRREKEC
jgi:hypothetical protein